MIKKFFIGIFSGIISGLFAAGGGMILVPYLTHILKLKEKEARAVSTFCILPMVVTSGIFYLNNDYIDWNLGLYSSLGGIIGGFLGIKLLNKVSDKVLKLVFTLFLIYTSLKIII